MANHYYDEDIDNCPIHRDNETDQFFRVELVMPIGLDKPHGSWKASANWALNLLDKIDPIMHGDEKKVLQYRLGIGHTGIEDDKSCFKYLIDDGKNNIEELD